MSSKKGFSGLDDLSSDIDDILNENHKDNNNTIEQKTESKDDKTNFGNNETVDTEKTSSTTSNMNNASTVTNNDSNNGSSSWIWWVIAVGVIGWIILQSNNTTSSSGKTSYSSASQQNYSSSTQSNNYTKTTTEDDYYESKPDAYLSILNKNQLLYCEAEKIRLDAVQNKIDLYSTYEVDKFNALTNDYNSRCANKQYYKNEMYYVERNIEKRKYELEKDGIARFSKSNNSSSGETVPSTKSFDSAKSAQECYSKGMYPSKFYSDGSVLCSKNNSSSNYNQNSSVKAENKNIKTMTNINKLLEYSLTINAIPSDAKVRILNIKPKYQHGIKLKKGNYHIEVSKDGYETINKSIFLDKDTIHNIELSKFIINNSKFFSTQNVDNNYYTVDSNSRKLDDEIAQKCGWKSYVYSEAAYLRCINEIKYKYYKNSKIK